MRLCACGCGQEISQGGARYVRGHNWAARRFKYYVEEDRGHSSPCWIWQGKMIGHNGYARVQYRGRAWPVHRAFYTELVGEIPDGLTIDHLCRVKLCVNPSHLEPVTREENARRGRATQTVTHGVFWTASEDAELLRLSNLRTPINEMARALNRSTSSVAGRRMRLGLSSRRDK